jgi:PhnB protein
MVKAIPEGFRTITPFLNVKDCAKYLDFLKQAFGAEERSRHASPDGKIMHAEMQIGDSRLMLSEAMQQPPTQSSIWLYVSDVDTWFKRAQAAGMEVKMPVADMFWGDRWGSLADKWGNGWSIASHKEDVAPAEMDKRAAAAMAQMAQQQQSKK